MRPQTYRFQLSDREYASAWLREYYRRPGLRVLRVASGPAIVVFGALMLRGDGAFARAMAVVTMLFGAWLALKPFLMAWALTSRRRRQRRSSATIEVRFDQRGMRVDDGQSTTELAWDRLRAASEARDYVWLELKSGARATIPRRAIDDLDALRELLSSKLEWQR